MTLGGWFVPAVGEAAGAVLVFNGNAGNRSFRAPLAKALSQRGYAVMLKKPLPRQTEPQS